MDPQFRVLAAFAEVLGMVPNTYMVLLCRTPVVGLQCFFFYFPGLYGHLHAHDADTQDTHTYTENIFIIYVQPSS